MGSVNNLYIGFRRKSSVTDATGAITPTALACLWVATYSMHFSVHLHPPESSTNWERTQPSPGNVPRMETRRQYYAEYFHLQLLMKWARGLICTTLPKDFRSDFHICADITDCITIFTERPTNMVARAQTWSKYPCDSSIGDCWWCGTKPWTKCKFLYGKCQQPVHWNQKEIQCDGCDRCHHTNCIGMSVSG